MRRRRFSSLVFTVAAVLGVGSTCFADGTSNQLVQTRPILLGTSGGNIKEHGRLGIGQGCCSGTLGALVVDSDGNYYLLSNNHVLSRINQGHRGDIITQPGLIDVDCLLDPSAAVGHLTTFVRMRGRNIVDAALALITSTNDVDVSGSIIGVGQPSSETYFPSIGDVVMKSGRTSGVTSGAVAAVDGTLVVSYQRCHAKNILNVRFYHQIIVTPSTFGSFSAGGDSGSLVVENTNSCPRPVGLLFAGTSSVTAVNPIDEVLAQLGARLGSTVTIVGCPAPPAPTRVMRESRGVSTASYKKASLAKAQSEDGLLEIKGVVGVGVGRLESNPAEATIEIFVDKDTPSLRAQLPSSINGTPCHVLETGTFVAH